MHALLLETQTELVTTNTSATHYFLSQAGTQQVFEKLDLFDRGIVSEGSIAPWGFYKILDVRSVFKKDTVQQQSLIGQKNKTTTAVFLADNDKPLLMVGKAKIIGNAYLPKKGIKKGYIKSQSFNRFQFLNGQKFTSGKRLPNISETFTTPEVGSTQTLRMEDIKAGQLLHNDFKNKTIEIQVSEPAFNHKKLSGNIIIRAKDSLVIKNDNSLEDVMIIAPKVVFEKGFNGTLQVKASAMVELQEKVTLRYPSGVFIDSEDALEPGVTLKKGAKLLGSIVVTNANSKNHAISLVSIQKGAELMGTLYCEGHTELRGKVTGSVYTNNFFLKTEASSYENYIEDGVIDRQSLPDFFHGNSFSSNEANKNGYGIIKTL